MSSIKPIILIVDDEPDYRSMVQESLSDDYDCYTAASGHEALELISSQHPKLVLADINMPEMDGFELCKHISELKVQEPISVFIVSGDNEVDTKIRAFSAGADDFISKPFELKELKSRVARTIEFIDERQKMLLNDKELRHVAELTMSQASQYSYIMNFIKSLNQCSQIDAVVNLFFEAMGFFELTSTIRFSLPEVQYFNCNQTPTSPIEKNIFEMLLNSGRLYDFGHRLMVNDKHVSFLVKNMPNDAEKVGEIRDFVAVVIEALEAKVLDMHLRSGLLHAVSELKKSIINIKEGIGRHDKKLAEVMTNMMTDISASYHVLELNEEQETYFTNLVENGVKEISKTDTFFAKAKDDLEILIESIERIKQESEPNISQLPLSSDIEMF